MQCIFFNDIILIGMFILLKRVQYTFIWQSAGIVKTYYTISMFTRCHCVENSGAAWTGLAVGGGRRIPATSVQLLDGYTPKVAIPVFWENSHYWHSSFGRFTSGARNNLVQNYLNKGSPQFLDSPFLKFLSV